MARSQSDAAFLKTARARFEMGQEAIHKQRARELADLAFYAGGDFQWDPDALKARRAQNADNQSGLPPMPARPVITVNKVREPIHQILNQERQSDMSIELAPADDFAGLVGPIDPTEIEVREGLVRRIQRASEAADARTWGFMRGVICGVGWWRVNTRYASGKTFDQDIGVGRIFNQASVTADPAHEQPDGSDIDWAFQGADLPLDRYKAEHPRTKAGEINRVAHADDDEFRAYGEEYPGWFASDGDRKSVRVVEYFYTEREVRKLVLLEDGTEAWKDELPDGTKGLDERDVVTKSVKWAKLDAIQVLEETDWPSQDIPFVKYVGEELPPFDEERRVEGIVRQARGSNEGYNAFISKFVEVVGLTPISNVTAAEGTLDEYKAWWQQRNTRALPWLPFKVDDLAGNKHPNGPQPLPHDSNVQELAMGLQIFDEAIKATTMIPAVQLGHQTDAHLKSGKAIQLMQAQAELGTSNYLDNLKRSIRREGEIINNLLYPIYGTKPGRLVRIMTGENESQTVQIGAMNGTGQPGGLPTGVGGNGQGTPATPPAGLAGNVRALPPPMGSMPGSRTPPKVFQLTKDANFNVVVKVTRAFENRRTEEATTIGNLIQANPPFMGWFGDLFFANQDGPGHEEMAERAKLMLAPPIQQMLAQKAQGSQLPPEVQAQFAQLQGRLQQAEQILQQAKQEIESKSTQHQIEAQSKMQIAQLERDKAIQLQAMKDAAQIVVARINAAKGHLDAVREDTEEQLALAQQQLHEAGQAELDRQHERDMASQQHQNALEQGAQGVAGTMATQANQAALQPPPTEPSPQT